MLIAGGFASPGIVDIYGQTHSTAIKRGINGTELDHTIPRGRQRSVAQHPVRGLLKMD